MIIHHGLEPVQSLLVPTRDVKTVRPQSCSLDLLLNLASCQEHVFFNCRSNEDRVSLRDISAVIFTGDPQGYASSGCLAVSPCFFKGDFRGVSRNVDSLTRFLSFRRLHSPRDFQRSRVVPPSIPHPARAKPCSVHLKPVSGLFDYAYSRLSCSVAWVSSRPPKFPAFSSTR
ncbi:hypothetical protein JTE90_020389 [Oedothorax gibbosus]|uniref:Uncharacterized protein n=1 Tax=Oedothorax gibbosus TaxID=931172 RepID=A0AAV6UEF7_9ARAC|nr:hypothetical protein JTE90_020389 [Oedothorax gibbosus]